MNQNVDITEKEWLGEVKKVKPSPIIDAFFIGFLVGIIMYSLMANTWGFLTLIPSVIVYWLLKKPKRYEALKSELKERGLQ